MDEVEISMAIAGLRRRIKENDNAELQELLSPMLTLIELAHERITELLVDEDE